MDGRVRGVVKEAYFAYLGTIEWENNLNPPVPTIYLMDKAHLDSRR